MNIVTYNLLHPYTSVLRERNHSGFRAITIKDPTMDNWKLRKRVVIYNLKHAPFSVCCLQDLTSEKYKELKTKFTGAGFSAHRNDKYSGVALFYNPSKVEMIRINRFKYCWEWKRGKVCCDFKDKESGRVVRVMSVHLTKESELQGMQELLYYHVAATQDKRIDAFVIAGSLSEGFEGTLKPLSRIKLLKDLGYKFDFNLKGTDKNEEKKVDWIFCKEMTEKGKCFLSPLEFPKEKTSGSDHLMAGSRLRFID